MNCRKYTRQIDEKSIETRPNKGLGETICLTTKSLVELSPTLK